MSTPLEELAETLDNAKTPDERHPEGWRDMDRIPFPLPIEARGRIARWIKAHGVNPHECAPHIFREQDGTIHLAVVGVPEPLRSAETWLKRGVHVTVPDPERTFPWPQEAPK